MVYDWLLPGKLSFSVLGFLLRWLDLGRLWRVYANAAGFIGVATLFAVTLNNFTAGTGAIYRVEGPPTGEGLLRTNPRLPLRAEIPLGGTLEFDLSWSTLEGGCERFVTRSFTRVGDPDNFTLSSRLKAMSHAVGRPGLEHIKIDLPPGITAGAWDYRSISEAQCRARTPPPVEFVHLVLDVVDRDGPVMRTLMPAKVASFVIKRGGPIRYRSSWQRFDASPSEIFNTYSRLDGATGAASDIVIERRPAQNKPPGTYKDVDISAPLPADVTAGRWRMKQVIISERPGGRTRVDPLVELEFEVAD